MSRLVLVSILILLVSPAFAQTGKQKDKTKKEKAKVERLAPTVAEFSYGPHARNVFDFWQAKSDRPTPLAVLIHGGG